MQNRAEAGQTRREMFRSSMRYLALGGLGLLSAGLLARPRGSSPAERRLGDRPGFRAAKMGLSPSAASCRRCSARATCRLPQALVTAERQLGDCPDFRAAKMGLSPSGIVKQAGKR